MSQEADRALLDKYNELLVADPRQYALGLPDGRYRRVERPFTSRVRRLMFEGQISVALYCLTPEGQVTQGIADSDKDTGLEDLKRLGHKFQELGIPTLLEASRRGGHLRFFHEPMAPSVTSLLLKKTTSLLDIEADIFPRRGLSCVRAPFSVHPRSKEKYPILDPNSLQPVSSSWREQFEFLTSFDRLPAQVIAQALAQVIEQMEKPEKPQTYKPFDKKPDVMEVLGKELELTKSGSVFRAVCPFHPDRDPSLVVYEATQSWFCYGCGRGGDSIKFLALKQGISDGEVLKDLRRVQGGR